MYFACCHVITAITPHYPIDSRIHRAMTTCKSTPHTLYIQSCPKFKPPSILPQKTEPSSVNNPARAGYKKLAHDTCSLADYIRRATLVIFYLDLIIILLELLTPLWNHTLIDDWKELTPPVDCWMCISSTHIIILVLDTCCRRSTWKRATDQSITTMHLV